MVRTGLKKSWKLETLGFLLEKALNTWDCNIKSNIDLDIQPATGEKHLKSDEVDFVDIGIK